MKKKMLISFMMAIILLLFLSCTMVRNNNKNKEQNNLSNSKNVYYKIAEVIYQNKDIKISYPEILDLRDIDKEKMINTLIKSEALKVLKYYEGVIDVLTLDINYNIKLKNANLLSIEYLGYGNVKDTAHPDNLLYTTNIDLVKGSRIILKDLVKINEDFVKKFKEGIYKKWKPNLNLESSSVISELRESLTNEELISDFNNADSLDNIGTENQSDTYSYLTKESLGISVDIAHALGDHVEFEINYKDLTDNIRTKSDVWKYLYNITSK
jgi:hypothetical protein